jgi:hypothetical protein
MKFALRCQILWEGVVAEKCEMDGDTTKYVGSKNVI